MTEELLALCMVALRVSRMCCLMTSWWLGEREEEEEEEGKGVGEGEEGDIEEEEGGGEGEGARVETVGNVFFKKI